jgi:NADH-quinone oxidoreductase subunit A
MPTLVGYLLLFLVVGFSFIFVHLMAGKFVRPAKPDAEKLTIYECGEPTVGSAWVQFDLRYYVVALLFVVFDVEVAFFFPWAVVFGTANRLASREAPQTAEQRQEYNELVRGLVPAYPENRAELAPYQGDEPLSAERVAANRQAAGGLAGLALLDIAVFFGVLLVGFAYLWRRGDINWVRSTAAEQAAAPPVAAPPPGAAPRELVGV